MLAENLVLTFSMFNITGKSYSHFSRGPENWRFAPGVGQNARPWALCINQPHLIISLLISHYQSDGIIGTLQYSVTLRQIIVIFWV